MLQILDDCTAKMLSSQRAKVFILHCLQSHGILKLAHDYAATAILVRTVIQHGSLAPYRLLSLTLQSTDGVRLSMLSLQ